MTRQKFVGWILIVVSTAYLVYFLKVRLFMPGPFIARGEWFQVIGCIATLMIGTINIRMAARAEVKRDVRR